jgi:hypothetical protein
LRDQQLISSGCCFAGSAGGCVEQRGRLRGAARKAAWSSAGGCVEQRGRLRAWAGPRAFGRLKGARCFVRVSLSHADRTKAPVAL